MPRIDISTEVNIAALAGCFKSGTNQWMRWTRHFACYEIVFALHNAGVTLFHSLTDPFHRSDIATGVSWFHWSINLGHQPDLPHARGSHLPALHTGRCGLSGGSSSAIPSIPAIFIALEIMVFVADERVCLYLCCAFLSSSM